MADNKTAQVKRLALNGDFDEVAKLFGVNAFNRAIAYVTQKIDHLRKKMEVNRCLDDEPCATPFMLFALDAADLSDVPKVSADFQISADRDSAIQEDDDDAESVATDLQGENPAKEEQVDEEDEADPARVYSPASATMGDDDGEKNEQQQENEQGQEMEVVASAADDTLDPPIDLMVQQQQHQQQEEGVLASAHPTASSTSSSTAFALPKKKFSVPVATTSFSSVFKPPASSKTSKITETANTKLGNKKVPSVVSGAKKSTGLSESKKVSSSSSAATGMGDKKIGGGKNDEKKEKKDPNKPKGASSAFMFFSKATRNEVVAANPGVSFGEVGALLGRQWAALSKEDREPFALLAADDKRRAQIQSEEYQLTNPSVQSNVVASNKGKDKSESKGKAKSTSKKRPRASSRLNFSFSDDADERRSRNSKSFQRSLGDSDADSGGMSTDQDDVGKIDESPKSYAAQKQKKNSETATGARLAKHLPNFPADEDQQQDGDEVVSLTPASQQDAEEAGDFDSDFSANSDFSNKRKRKRGTGNSKEKAHKSMLQATVTPLKSSKSRSKHASFSNLSSEFVASSMASHKNKKMRSSLSGACFPGSSGIKQADLSKDDDLLNTKLNAPLREKFAADFMPAAGERAVLVLQPYIEFRARIASLLPSSFCSDHSSASQQLTQDQRLLCVNDNDNADTLNTRILQDVDSLLAWAANKHSTRKTLNVLVESVRPIRLPLAPEAARGYNKCRHLSNKLTVITITMCTGGTRSERFEMLYAPFSSPLSLDRFLILRDEYMRSLRQPWLTPGAPIRRAFAVSEDEGGYYDEEGGAKCGSAELMEWMEGCVYHVREDYLSNPYNSVLVTWLGQETGVNHWVFRYTQTDCECSPWDLRLSAFVLPEKLKAQLPQLPRSLLAGKLSPHAILDYLKSQDFAWVFSSVKLSQSSEYCAMFPDPNDQLDLAALSLLCCQGRYDDPSCGVLTLFRDLERMVAHGKRFNTGNEAFLPWRLVDVCEKVQRDVLREIAETRHMPALLEAIKQVTASSTKAAGRDAGLGGCDAGEVEDFADEV